MFDFLENSIIYFDTARENFANFHIAFLAGLCSWLGFEPSGRTNPGDNFFDMKNGIFLPVPPVHGNYASQEVSDVLAGFFSSSYDSSKDISLNGKLRNDVLGAIIEFYSLHLPSLKKINSLEVLKEVFKG